MTATMNPFTRDNAPLTPEQEDQLKWEALKDAHDQEESEEESEKQYEARKAAGIPDPPIDLDTPF